MTLVVAQGLRLAAIGAAIGLGLAWLAGAALRAQLVGISPRDPVAFAAMTAMLLAVAAAACALPARRAAALDPVTALRNE